MPKIQRKSLSPLHCAIYLGKDLICCSVHILLILSGETANILIALLSCSIT